MNLRKAFLMMALCFLIFFPNHVDAATSKPILTAKQEEDYIRLNWTAPDDRQPYSFRVFSKSSKEEDFQSIPTKERIKVLNVYPDGRNVPSAGTTTFVNYKGETHTIMKSASIKQWMEEPNKENSKGYGKGLIDVDVVSISDFNASPDKYLKKGSAFVYDVLVAGTWDTNARQDLSSAALKSIESFITTGRGFLAGHDTITQYHSLNNFAALAKYMNIKTYPYKNNVFKAETEYINMPWIGSESITVKKRGLLTSYPWNIGEIGTNLNIPYSHTNSQVALGDVWMTFSNWRSDFPDLTVGIGPEMNDPSTKKGTNNVYLTTYNNTAMIQTGHSNAKATSDEQKVVANTLFYLAQVSEQKTWNDRKAQDTVAPTKPIINDMTFADGNIKLNAESHDVGENYNYFVEAKGADGLVYKSDPVSITKESGLKGYSFALDTSSNTIPTNQVSSSTGSMTIPVPKDFKTSNSVYYLHIKSVDNDENASEVSHIKISPPNLSITPSTDNWAQSLDLSVTGNSDTPGITISSIQLLNGYSGIQNRNLMADTEFNSSDGWEIYNKEYAAGDIQINDPTFLVPSSVRKEVTKKNFLSVRTDTKKDIKSGSVFGLISSGKKLNLQKGKEYTVSFQSASNEFGNTLDHIKILYSNGDVEQIPSIKLDNAPSAQDIQFSFQSKRDDSNAKLLIAAATNRDIGIPNTNNNSYAWLTLHGLKVEEGTKTSYTRAPEDVVYSNKAQYTVNENGKYTFKVIDSLGRESIQSIDIQNIDNKKPTFSIDWDSNTFDSDLLMGTIKPVALSGIKEIKFAAGHKDINYMKGIESVAGDNLKTTTNGTHTVYLKSGSGVETVETIDINQLKGILKFVSVPETLDFGKVLLSKENDLLPNDQKLIIWDSLKAQDKAWKLQVKADINHSKMSELIKLRHVNGQSITNEWLTVYSSVDKSETNTNNEITLNLKEIFRLKVPINSYQGKLEMKLQWQLLQTK